MSWGGAQTSTPLMPAMAKRTESIEEVKRASPVKEVKTEDEEQLKIIDDHITERHIEGKWRGKVVIHGRLFASDDYNMGSGDLDYQVLPLVETQPGKWEEEISPQAFWKKIDPTGRMFIFEQACYGDAGRKKSDTSPVGINFTESLNMVYIKDSSDPTKSWLTILAPNTQADKSSRKTYFARLFCNIPTNKLNELILMINNNPDNAERFIQMAFAGIDDNTGRPTGRIPVNKVSLVDLDIYIPTNLLDEDKAKTNLVGRGFLYEFMENLKYKNKLNLDAVITKNFSHPLPEY